MAFICSWVILLSIMDSSFIYVDGIDEFSWISQAEFITYVYSYIIP